MVWPAIIAAAAAVGGALASNRRNKKNAAQQEATQREFAQQGVRWKVEDAKAAGLHPLYALGAQTTAYQPIAVQDQLGPALASSGQDISRAIRATKTSGEREAADLQLRNLRLQGDLIQEQILASQAGRHAQASQPPFPGSPGAVSFPVRNPELETTVLPRDQVVSKAREIVSESSMYPGTSAGISPMFDLVRDRSGNEYFLLNQQAAESLEDNNWIKSWLTSKANYPWLQDLEDRSSSLFNKPEFVDRWEKQSGERMIPVRKAGKLYWRFKDGR